MKVIPDGLCPESATPEETMEQVGRRLFSVTPEEMKRRLADDQAERERQREAGVKKRGRPRKAKV